MAKKIYVAATSQHIGKTTSTLGLVHALIHRGHNVGYCKPVGQEFVDLGDLHVDKDALLFSNFMKFNLDANVHSPVILGKVATAAYLHNPNDFNYPQRIDQDTEILEQHHDIIVYEGTGHPGVGSVVKLSNATVAKRLGADVILVVEGGIGNTIDRINLSLSLFREQNVPILGIIVNKVLVRNIDKIRRYIKGYLDQQGLKLLGVIPYDESLAYPLMSTVRKAIRGKTLLNRHKLITNKVEKTIDSALVDMENLKSTNLLLVISSRRLDKALEQVKIYTKNKNLSTSPLAGIVITASHPISESSKQYINEHEIPVVYTTLDTFGAVVKISKIEVKINLKTPGKVQRAVQLIGDHVDMDTILSF